ncbi:MAG TPA: glycosyltransferase family 4 protein, partial [Candidatus Cybelea sp.]
LDAADLRRAYDDATIVAMPSLWGEPFGLAGIEAFARGRPVIAYDVGAISEWLRSGLGQLVPRGDERALGAAILGLLGHDAWAESSPRAFEASHSYRIAAHVERIGEIYRQ